jgi:UDP-4-amino-4,6-dideoxy-N-acetyl-beta-L-altrosamine transaminase
MSTIPYGRQNISEDDIKAVVEVLRSDFLTQGPVVPEFERTVSMYCGSAHAVAVNSATSALHIACLALGVGPGDVVWTSPITFVASANCARYCGADVDFVDIDSRTFNMSTAALARKLELAKSSGRLPKVVIPVHMCGQSCDMQSIHGLSKQYGFRIIEDASHAIGASYLNEKVGCCRYSDITVFSFHPVKIITTGEGGMAVTNCAELVKKMARLRSHGITRYPSEMTAPPDGAWYYQQIELGFNYRMTDIQAALGLSQMARLDEFVSERHLVAERYSELLKGFELSIPWQHPDTHSSLHLYVVRLNATGTLAARREVFDRMRSDGIGVNIHYIPVYRQPYYAQMGFSPADYPEAEQYYAEAITLPIFPDLTVSQQQQIVNSLTKPSGYQTIF